MIGLLLLTPLAFAPARPVALAPRAPIAASPPLTMAPPLAPPRARLAASPRMDTTTPGPDYKLAGSFVLLGALTLAAPWLVGGFLLLFGILLVVQTLRIRFVFDDEAIEVKTIDLLSADGALAAITGGPAPLEKTGENFAVGGENRWRYDSFVNWEFFPSVDVPILVYFKETQTPEESWGVGPGEWANNDAAIAKGAVKGQVHFFPCIASAQELRDQFIERGCAKL